MLHLFYEILREKSLVTLENRILLNLTLNVKRYQRYARVVHGFVNANAINILSWKK